MIITCPQCSRRYLIEDHLLAQRRRQLRCGECSHVWRHNGESAPQASSETVPIPPSLPPESHQKPFSFSDDPLLPLRRRLPWGWAMYWGVCIGLLGSFVLCRHSLVHHWPILKPVYETLRLPLHQTQTLALVNLHMWPVHDKQSGLLLRGEILNKSVEAHAIPPLRIFLRPPADSQPQRRWTHLYEQWFGQGASPQGGYTWTHRLSHSKVMPGETLRFEIVLPYEGSALHPRMAGGISF